jgi:hypothetical protein
MVLTVETVRIAAIVLDVILLTILALKVRRIIKDFKEYNGKNRL